MKLNQIAALSYKLHELIVARNQIFEDSTVKWRNALTVVLLKYFNHEVDYGFEYKHHQFVIQHRSRANCLYFYENNNSIEVIVVRINEGTLTIQCRFNDVKEFFIQLNLDHFPSELYDGEGPRILANAQEVNYLLKRLIDLSVNPNDDDVHDVDKFEAFHAMYVNCFDIYQDFRGAEESVCNNFIETVFGAGIFYLPQVVASGWSGLITKDAFLQRIQNLGSDGYVKDHIFSRKRAANLIFNREAPITLQEFIDLYQTCFRKFAYVTTAENMLLVNWHHHQGDEINIDEFLNSYTDCARNLGIEFFDFQETALQHSKINALCRNIRQANLGVQNLTFEQIVEYLP
jgi:hypothetical protein